MQILRQARICMQEANNMEMMEDHHFKQEVAETLLRCIKEHIAHENVIIELNGLKIAEDKTFADCARFILTTSLGLCMPPPDSTLPEYRSLYATEAPESSKVRLNELGHMFLFVRSTTPVA